MTDGPHRITTHGELDALYGAPVPAAVIKELDHISDDYAAFIVAAPFVAVATCGPGGLDCTPRGDPPGFVRIVDRTTLMLPDRRGNNRIDTLRNLVEDPRIALLFLIPGVGDTLRVNGRAAICADPALCASFAMEGKAPRTVLVIAVERVYFQCRKALVRSRLWDPATQIDRAALPSTGTMLQNLQREFDGAAYDAAYPERMKQTIY